MTDQQFDAMVTLIQQLASRAAGNAIYQPRAGSEDEDIEHARSILVTEEEE